MNDPLVMDLNEIRTAMIQSNASVGSTISGIPASTFAQSLDSKLPSFESEIQKKKYFNLDVTVKQPVFMGGKIVAANRQRNLKRMESLPGQRGFMPRSQRQRPKGNSKRQGVILK